MIACEVVRDCQILVLDNPVYNMDYEEQVDIISSLKEIVNTNKIVIMTLEQPAIDILRQFDKLLLLQEGCEVYSGYIDDIKETLEEYNVKLPDCCDPVDYLYNVLNMSDRAFKNLNEDIFKERMNHGYNLQTKENIIRMIKDN
jgi:ABC-type multidrug transport system ATPase subunit